MVIDNNTQNGLNLPKLDNKDRKILLELDIDARQSLKQIARKLRTTKEVVNYRIKQLEQKGIITKYNAITHFPKLGMTHYKLYIKFSHTKQSHKQEIIDFLLKQRDLGWLASTEGTFDLMVAIRFPNTFEFEKFKDDMFSRFDGMFQRNSFAVLTEAETYPRQYLVDEKNPMRKVFLFCDPTDTVKIDNTDMKLIKAVSKNSRASATEIAKMTGLSERVVRYRRKELEKRGILIGYKLAIDYRKLGYLFFKCLIKFQHLTPEKLKKFKAYARQHPNVVHWLKVLGEWDLELEVETPSIDEFYKITNEIRSKFNDIIQTIDTALVSEEHMISHA